MLCSVDWIAFVLTALNVILLQSDAVNTGSGRTLEINTSNEMYDIEVKASAKYIGAVHINEPQSSNFGFLNTAVCTREYSCLNCSISRVCTPDAKGGFVEVSRTVCPLDRPTCDPKTGTCVAEPLDECIHPATPKCFMKFGSFPHPTDCTKFYYCKNYIPSLFECEKPFHYNFKEKKCTPFPCYSINCYYAEGRKVRYPFSRKYFAYCSGGSPVGIDECDGVNVFNTTSQLCEPSCDFQSFAADDNDCTRYYRCDYEWVNGYRTLVEVHDECPIGHIFKEEVHQCVPGNITVDCFKE